MTEEGSTVMTEKKVIDMVTRIVMERMQELEGLMIHVGVSNRHVHVSQRDLAQLFGPGYQLTCKNNLMQPGQYAAKETVTIQGPKGEFAGVRILGPVRKESQVEISLADTYRLGIKAPIKESGCLDQTPGIRLIGPYGSVTLNRGTIVALRHVHMTTGDAARMGVADKDFVCVETLGERKGILGDVLVRVSDDFRLELHVDVDEANACALKNGDFVILKKEQRWCLHEYGC